MTINDNNDTNSRNKVTFKNNLKNSNNISKCITNGTLLDTKDSKNLFHPTKPNSLPKNSKNISINNRYEGSVLTNLTINKIP